MSKAPHYRMIALDVDGTLLDSRGRLSLAVRAAVRAAVNRGVLVTLATGRRFADAAEAAAELGLELPLVLSHGAVIQDSLTGEVLYEDALPTRLLREVIVEVLEAGQQVVLHCSPAAEFEVLAGLPEHDSAASAAYLARQDAARLLRLPAAELAAASHALSVAVFHYDDVLRPLYARLAARPDCTATFWEPGQLWSDYMLEVIHADCSKASALRHLAAQYGIGMHEVMAIGDERNDLEMLASVGLGVAMGNARPEVHAVARVSVGTNDEDGVAEAIHRYVLTD
jgi:5-amino-6-(5-phospho-D-ribitylamino)uracil phosphatase